MDAPTVFIQSSQESKRIRGLEDSALKLKREHRRWIVQGEINFFFLEK
jgi:hypothetical protein